MAQKYRANGLWALPRPSPAAATHLWSSSRQRLPLYPHGSLPDKRRFPDRWLTLSLSSGRSRLFRIWSRTWQRTTTRAMNGHSKGWLNEANQLSDHWKWLGGWVNWCDASDGRLYKVYVILWWLKTDFLRQLRLPAASTRLQRQKKMGEQLFWDEGMAKWKVLSAGTLAVPLLQYL